MGCCIDTIRKVLDINNIETQKRKSSNLPKPVE